jgi:hypothetical protein
MITITAVAACMLSFAAPSAAVDCDASSEIMTLTCYNRRVCQDNSGESGRWQFRFTPYMWVTRHNGSASIGEETGSINTSYGDFSRFFNGGGFFFLEAKKKRWVYFIDFKSNSFGNRILDESSKSTLLDLEQTTIDLGAMRIHDKGDWTIAPVYGARYQEFRIMLVPEDEVLVERIRWPEPFIGIYANYDISDKCYISARGDGGLFKLDRGTAIWFNGKSEIGYELAKDTDLVFGYQTQKHDYDGLRGGLSLRSDGPYVGVTFGF